MNQWPVLKHYDQNHIAKIALPLGGIGTGTLSLGGRGDYRDCEIMNAPAKGNVGVSLFFCLRAKGDGGESYAKLLEGPMADFQYEGAYGATASCHGLPRFRNATFDAAYPFGQVHLSEEGAPVEVMLQAFNPLVPADADASGYPCAVLRYTVRNVTDRALTVSVCGTANNCTGEDKPGQVWKNVYKSEHGISGIEFSSETASPTGADSEGTVVLATPDGGDLSWRTSWLDRNWAIPMLDFWDDFTADGQLDERPATGKWRRGSLCNRQSIPAHDERSFTFILAWRFPNRRTWTPLPADQREGIEPSNDPDIIGNYYCTRFATAWAAAAELAENLQELEARTVDFVTCFLQSPVPDFVKEAALFNVSTLRTQTCFRTADGNFFGWEGCGNNRGSCHGSCTHVWNYEQTTAYLFGSLARNMRETEFLHSLNDDGLMSFRVNLPLERGKNFGRAAADGQLGCIMKAYREWRLSGDTEFLKTLWPSVKRALEFCWVPKGWDGDKDGVMEGCQHNTMDVEYYGPNGQMQGWYVCALKCAEIMSAHLGDTAFAETCRTLCEAGAKAMDEQLFNGEYYEQIVIPPHSAENIYPGLRHNMGTSNFEEPEVQLGKACLVDQLVGPYMAKVVGLPDVLNPEHVKKTLQSIYAYNRRCGMWDHFNNMRTFAAGDESALLMASYPRGERPTIPFPYFSEVMTGFEYTAATGMLYAGLKEEGLQVIADIRKRYDGAKRSPFNEAECGHHYARAMAAWSAYLALTGFQYDGVKGEMRLDIGDGTWFWSTGNAYGTCTLLDGMVRFKVCEGTVRLNCLHVGGRSYEVNQVLSGRSTIRL